MARKDAAFPARRAIKDNVGDVRKGGMPPLIGIVFVDQGIERMGDVVKRRSPGVFFLQNPMKALRTAGVNVTLERLEQVDGLTRYRRIRERQDVEDMIQSPDGEKIQAISIREGLRWLVMHDGHELHFLQVEAQNGER